MKWPIGFHAYIRKEKDPANNEESLSRSCCGRGISPCLPVNLDFLISMNNKFSAFTKKQSCYKDTSSNKFLQKLQKPLFS